MDFWILYQQESTVDLMIQVIIDSLINGCIYFFEYHLLEKICGENGWSYLLEHFMFKCFTSLWHSQNKLSLST